MQIHSEVSDIPTYISMKQRLCLESKAQFTAESCLWEKHYCVFFHSIMICESKPHWKLRLCHQWVGCVCQPQTEGLGTCMFRTTEGVADQKEFGVFLKLRPGCWVFSAGAPIDAHSIYHWKDWIEGAEKTISGSQMVPGGRASPSKMSPNREFPISLSVNQGLLNVLMQMDIKRKSINN